MSQSKGELHANVKLHFFKEMLHSAFAAHLGFWHNASYVGLFSMFRRLYPYTVEPRPVDSSPLWTPYRCGHFCPAHLFPYIMRSLCTISDPWPHLVSQV